MNYCLLCVPPHPPYPVRRAEAVIWLECLEGQKNSEKSVPGVVLTTSHYKLIF
jgi:hypothetical protein